jgi:hypothetical protein
MGLQWQTKILKDGDQANFDFGNPVSAYAAGISYFNLLFSLSGNNSYALKDMGIGLTVSQPGQNIIIVSASLNMDNGSGTLLDTTESSVYVTVIAWVGLPNGGLFLGTSPNLSSGQQFIQTNSITPFFSGSFLNGISTGFTSGQNVREITANVNGIKANNGLMENGQATIINGSGVSSTATNISAGIIAALTPTINMEMGTLPFNDPSGSASQPISFNSNVKQAIALLTSFDFSFSSAANITGIYAGLAINNPPFNDPTGPLVPQISIDPGNPKNVTVNYLGTMFDYANNTVCSSNNVSLLVIAITE